MLCISREMLLHLLWKRMHQHFLSYCFSSFLLRFKSSASTARQFSVCARNLSNAALGPTAAAACRLWRGTSAPRVCEWNPLKGWCWCSCVPWESREDLGTHQEEEFLVWAWDQASHGASSFATVVGGGYHKIRSSKLGTCKQRLRPLSGMHVPGECWPMRHWRSKSRRRKGVGLDACSLRVVEEPNSLKPKVSF